MKNENLELNDEGNLELNDEWNFYFHAKNNTKKYSDNTTKIATVKKISELWNVYNNIPTPQEMFSECNVFKNIKKTGEIPSAISIFRSNSFPQWEHKTNNDGYEWSMKKQKNLYNVNELWINLIATILGESFENSELINGIRIVDCSIENKIMYRYEVWISKKKRPDYFENLIKTILYTPKYIKLIYRDHSTLKESNQKINNFV